MNYSPEVFLKACELADIQPISRVKFAISLLEEAQDIINRHPQRYIPLDAEMLMEDVCQCRGITIEQLHAKRGSREVTDTKAAFAVLAKKVFPKMKEAEIAKLIHKDRTTILYYLKENNFSIEKNKVYQKIRKKLHI